MIFKKLLPFIALFLFYSSFAAASTVLPIINISMTPAQQSAAPGSTVDLYINFTVSPASPVEWDPSLVASGGNFYAITSGINVQYYDAATNTKLNATSINTGGSVYEEGLTTPIGSFAASGPTYYPDTVVGIGDTVQFLYNSFTFNPSFAYNENDKVYFIEDYDINFSDGSRVYVGNGVWTTTIAGVTTPTPTPLPNTIWLFSSGLIGLIGAVRHSKT